MGNFFSGAVCDKSWGSGTRPDPTADVAGRQHLRSASEQKLIVPRYRLNSFGRLYFAVASPSTWNSLPDSLRDPALQSEHV